MAKKRILHISGGNIENKNARDVQDEIQQLEYE